MYYYKFIFYYNSLQFLNDNLKNVLNNPLNKEGLLCQAQKGLVWGGKSESIQTGYTSTTSVLGLVIANSEYQKIKIDDSFNIASM